MLKLGAPLGWDPAIYESDQKAQDDFLEELNIKTYNEFKNYLFWEVLQGLTKMYIIHMDIHQTNDQLQQLENRIGTDEEQQEGDAEDLNKTEAEKKLQLRLELEFETIDDERKDAMDVEEIKFKEQRMMKDFVNQQDESYTSAHVKAGRKIMAALMRLKQKRVTMASTTAGFNQMRKTLVNFIVPSSLHNKSDS